LLEDENKSAVCSQLAISLKSEVLYAAYVSAERKRADSDIPLDPALAL
jgi:hypothetical protein